MFHYSWCFKVGWLRNRERNKWSKAVLERRRRETVGGETPPPSPERQATIESPSLSLSSDGRRKTYWYTYSQLVASAKPRCCVSFSYFCSDIITPCSSCVCACQNENNCVISGSKITSKVEMNTNNHIKRQPHSDGAPGGQTHGGGHGFCHAVSSRQRLMPYAHLPRPCHLHHYLSLQESHGGCCRLAAFPLEESGADQVWGLWRLFSCVLCRFFSGRSLWKDGEAFGGGFHQWQKRDAGCIGP